MNLLHNRLKTKRAKPEGGATHFREFESKYPTKGKPHRQNRVNLATTIINFKFTSAAERLSAIEELGSKLSRIKQKNMLSEFTNVLLLAAIKDPDILVRKEAATQLLNIIKAKKISLEGHSKKEFDAVCWSLGIE